MIPSQIDINQILKKREIGYIINDEKLELRDGSNELIAVVDKELSLEEKTKLTIRNSLKDADDLLSDGQHRAALQETLWLLESVSTVFRGLETETHSVEGKYFNKIIRDLKKAYKGQSLERILEWMANLHGFLSSPTGGGIRHGIDLNKGIEISPNEARLYCNLIRSYTSFLLSEHARFSTSI